jgi:lipoate-protein ligase A
MLSRTPTLRFYGWEPPAVTIGYFQGIGQEVDLDKCAQMGVDVVRRLTGGGAVFHEHELTYSFIAPEESFVARDILKSYGQICGFIIGGLRKLGLEAEFKPVNDIIVNGKKISGNAQTRRGGMILQHGTIILSLDAKKMFSVLKVPDEKIRDKMISAVEERVTSLERELGTKISFSKVKETITDFVKQDSHIRVLKQGALFSEELEKAEELAETKYSSKEWNHMR